MPPKTADTEIKITVSGSTGILGSRNESTFIVDREEWEEMTDDEKDGLARETLFEFVEWDWQEEK